MSPVTVEDLHAVTKDGRLFARVWGGRDTCRVVAPIVLFHDSLGCVELWRDFPAALASVTEHPVVAYDRLGFGRSDPYPGDIDIGFVRHEARSTVPALRDALGMDQMILFGHSVGGAMAIVTAALFPDATAAVITESAQVFIEDRTLAAIREAKQAFKVPGQLDRLARYHSEKAGWVLRAWTDTWLHPQFSGVVVDDDLARLRCPVLAMHGDRDEYGSHAHPDRIGRLAPAGSEVLIFPDCGHVPHREKPDLVLTAARAFLNSTWRRGSSGSSPRTR